MPIDPATGLPTDDNGNILSAEGAGSDILGSDSLQSTPTPAAHPAASIPMPGEAVPALPAGTKSVGVTYKGITPQGVAATTSLNKKADKAAMGDVARFQGQYDEQTKAAEGIASKERDALRMQTDAYREHSAKELDLWKAQQHFITEQGELEKHAFAQSKIVREQYLANYERDLLGAKVLAMQSGNPYGRMSGVQAAGLIGAAAIQGFLKVGGHNIDVMGQMDRFVDREIAEHGQRVQDARAAAQDQLHLYQVAKQQSQDEWEARERYRGMVMEAMKAQVGMEAARFNSQLALATAAQKSAEIDAGLLTIKSQLADRQQKLYFTAQQMRINQAAEQARNSVAWHQANTARMAVDAKKDKDQKNAIIVPDPGAQIIDPTTKKVLGVKNRWTVDPDAPDSVKSKLAEAGKAYAQLIPAAKKLRELREPAMDDFVEQYGSFAGTRLSEAKRLWQNQKTLAIMGLRHAIAGANLTPQEKAEWDAVLENDSGWQSGNNAAKIEQLEKQYRDNFIAEMGSNPYVRQLSEEDQKKVGDRPTGEVSNETDKRYDAFFHSGKAFVTPVQEADALSRKSSDKGAGQPGQYHAAYKKFLGMEAPAGLSAGEAEAEFATHMDRLAAIALQPEGVANQLGADPKTVANQALEALEAIGRDESLPPLRRKYADYLSGRIVEEPDELANDMVSTGMEFR